MADGELYYTIKNGVRLSGMPAFGDPGDDDVDGWKLVTFIRHLPHLTTALDDHKAIAHFPIPSGADVAKFDAGNGRVYAACSSGTISIVLEVDPQHFRKIEDVAVQKLVHSLAVDPSTHRVYAPEQEDDGQPVARIVVYEPRSK